MNNASLTVAEVGVSAALSTAVSVSANLDLLWTALITLAISIVTAVGGEIVKYLVAFFQDKRKRLEESDKKEEEKE